MKRRNDNERKSNKKKAVIIGLTAGISTVVLAFSLYMNYSKQNVPTVETGNPGIESVIENTTPDINDVLPDSELDIKVEEVTSNEVENEGVDSSEIVEDDTGTQETTPSQEESIVSSETTTAPTEEETSIVDVEETVKEETQTTEQTETAKTETTAPKESTEVQDVVPASGSTTPSSSTTLSDIEAKLAAAGFGADTSGAEVISGSNNNGGTPQGGISWQ